MLILSDLALCQVTFTGVAATQGLQLQHRIQFLTQTHQADQHNPSDLEANFEAGCNLEAGRDLEAGCDLEAVSGCNAS